MAFFQACRKSYEAASARRKIVRLTEKLPFLKKLQFFLQNCQIWLNDFLKIDISEVSCVVMGRVYPNPKTRRVLGHFHKPEATRTRNFENFLSPNVPEPEIFEFL